LTQIPFTVFQIESIKFLKLSNNSITELPTSPNTQDDKHTFKTSKNHPPAWNCHNLEEAHLDNNQLTNLPFQIFQLRSLKHLNISKNHLQTIPEQLWSAPQLLELNASFNRIQILPLISKQSLALHTPSIKSDPEVAPSRPTTRSRKPDSPTSPSPVITDPLQPTVDPTKLTRQMQISYEQKSVAKGNFWRPYSALDTNATNFEEEEEEEEPLTKQSNKDFKPKQNSSDTQCHFEQQQRQCPLKELNLSNNLFEHMPECLSCMTPRLIKLNLSFNRLESMGAVCDLPKSLKFLDLSNNSIKFSMRLLNEKLLLLLISYLEGLLPSSGDYRHFLNRFSTQTHFLLDNDFCYQALVNSLKESLQQQISPSRQQQQQQQQQYQQQPQRFRVKSPVKVSNKILNSNFSANRRRARSQSRSHRHVLSVSKIPAGLSTGHTSPQIPFDIFILNVKNAVKSVLVNSVCDLDMRQFADPEAAEKVPTASEYDLDVKEKKILSCLNIQAFMEHVCPHKRHIKLENLKSLNLSHNKLKRSKLMLDLRLVCEEGGGLPHSTSQLASLLLAEEEAKRQQVKNDSVAKKLQEAAAALVSSESEMSLSQSDESLDESWTSVKKVKEKARIVKTGKHFPVDKGKSLKRNSVVVGGYLNKKEERSKMIGKLMFPSLTHLVS